MNKLKLSFIMIIVATLGVSCQRGDIMAEPDQMTPQDEGVQVVPLEAALSTLEAFLEGEELTRAGGRREIESISVYYGPKKTSDVTLTRSDTTGDDDESENEEPLAYLVNFANDEGFAVLGANADVDDIIAVTENGHILDDLTVVVDEALDEEMEDALDGDDIDEPVDTVGVYCEEDDDFYCAAVPYATVVRTLLIEGINGGGGGMGDGGGGGGGGSGWTPGSGGGNDNPSRLTTKTPLLNYSWGQGEPYNKYCKRKNLVFSVKSALVGCSAVALSMIMARNEFPQSYTVKGHRLNWEGIKAGYKIEYLSETSKEDLALLLGSVYNTVKKVAVKGATMITPEQIKKRMEAVGYTYVKKYSANAFTKSMIMVTSAMLAQDRPVFISAIPPASDGWKHGHSWVIDGGKYVSESSNRYLLHFNFGWRGTCNGYFSTSCLNPARGVEYDGHVDPEKDFTYTWHFRLITYDIPDENVFCNVSF